MNMYIWIYIEYVLYILIFYVLLYYLNSTKHKTNSHFLSLMLDWQFVWVKVSFVLYVIFFNISDAL